MEQQALRNVLFLKLIRIYRVGLTFIPIKSFQVLVSKMYEPDSRDEKIALNRQIANIVDTVNQFFKIILFTYFFGLIWYRLSDYLLIQYALPEEPEERYWVVQFKLRRPSSEKDLGDLMPVQDRLILCCYYMLTTLSTVGYGDYYPFSISEKLVGTLF